jgi:hypothetical protein
MSTHSHELEKDSVIAITQFKKKRNRGTNAGAGWTAELRPENENGGQGTPAPCPPIC